MKQIMRSTAVFLFVLIFVSFAQAGTPKMVIEQETYDAGEQYRSGKLEHEFVIKNAGDAELQILSAKPG